MYSFMRRRHDAPAPALAPVPTTATNRHSPSAAATPGAAPPAVALCAVALFALALMVSAAGCDVGSAAAVDGGVARASSSEPAAAHAGGTVAVAAERVTAAGGPAGAETFTGGRTDSAGIEIVTSGRVDRHLPWRPAERFSLGGGDDGQASFYRLHRRLLATDDAGRIHVLDPVARQVVTFDDDGDLLRVTGRRGGGAGEMEQPASLAVASDGGIAVFDAGRMALARWDAHGSPLPSRPFPFGPAPHQRHFALADDGYRVATRGVVDGERANRLLAVTDIDSDTTRLATVPLPGVGFVLFDRCGAGVDLPPLFTPTVVWDHRGGITAVAAGDDYRIDLWRDGRRFRSVRRPLEPRPATRTLATAEAGEGLTLRFGGAPCVIPPGELVGAVGWAETVPAIRRLALAPDGSLWVERWVPGVEPGPIDRFDADGVYRGTFPPGAPFPALLLERGRAGIVRTDDRGRERLVVVEVAAGRLAAIP